MEIVNEMTKLRSYLNDNGIAWRDDSEEFDFWWMCRTKFKVNGHEFSVINGVGSYGGCMYVALKTKDYWNA